MIYSNLQQATIDFLKELPFITEVKKGKNEEISVLMNGGFTTTIDVEDENFNFMPYNGDEDGSKDIFHFGQEVTDCFDTLLAITDGKEEDEFFAIYNEFGGKNVFGII